MNWPSFAIGFGFGAFIMFAIGLHIISRMLKSWSSDVKQYNLLMTWLFEDDEVKSQKARDDWRAAVSAEIGA